MTDQTTVSGSDAGRQDEQPQGHRALSTTQPVQGLDAAAGVPGRQPFKLDPPPVYDEHYAATQEDAADGVPVAPSAQQLLDGAQFVQHRGGGQYRTCAEWDAAGVFVPLAKWQALVKHLDGVALPHSRPRCRKESGMCAMVPDGAGNPATGICPECGVDCGNACVGGIRYTSWCDEHGRATPCDKCQQTTNWPETVLMVRAWFEGNADAALAELEHRAKSGATT